ncbi:hypothetical protein [Photobacterium lipolyticum]|uniref:Uncharacterized protein n=1 Tax=Photobacterium lipolyticum TaxID=266810 RepID=A0A2T3MW47_9GAMM|nr:hypothetical protein [Photobacterium lipolyticum]PSW04188.1 hypothetical protein C9I89_14515 [Photobacterium lipolyticum]
MAELSQTLCNQRKLCTAAYNVHEEPTIESWQALLSVADTVNQSAVEELIQLKSELAELMSSSMKLSLPQDDADEEELITNRLCELNAEIEEKAQSFVELNAIRLDAQQEAERARQALATQHS